MNIYTEIKEFYSKLSSSAWYSTFIVLSSISFIFTASGLILLAYGYVFLYGYYFSGMRIGYQSIFNLLTNIVPFHYYTILIITVMFFLVCAFIFSGIKLIKTNKRLIFPYSFVFIIIHFCLSVFFVNGENVFFRALEFLIIWALPVAILLIFYWGYRTSSVNGYYSILGIFLGLDLCIIVFPYTNWDVEIVSALTPYWLFAVSILFTLIKDTWKTSRLVSYLIHLPITYFILFILTTISKLNIVVLSNKTISTLLLILIAFFINIILDTLFRWFIIKRRQSVKTNKNKDETSKSTTVKETSRKVERSWLNLFMGSVILLLLITVVPLSSLLAGHYVRDMTNLGDSDKKYICSYDYQTGIRGDVVSFKDGVYYISDENWELITLKGTNIVVENQDVCNNNN